MSVANSRRLGVGTVIKNVVIQQLSVFNINFYSFKKTSVVDLGSNNVGFGHLGDGNIGFGNTGNGNIGFGHSGDGNIAFANWGNNNSGIGLLGSGNSGFGGWNAGTDNVGLFNSGTGNTGIGNAGSFNTGSINLGSFMLADSQGLEGITIPIDFPAIPIDLVAGTNVAIPVTGFFYPITIQPIPQFGIRSTCRLPFFSLSMSMELS